MWPTLFVGYIHIWNFLSEFRQISRMAPGMLKKLEFRQKAKDSHPWPLCANYMSQTPIAVISWQNLACKGATKRPWECAWGAVHLFNVRCGPCVMISLTLALKKKKKKKKLGKISSAMPHSIYPSLPPTPVSNNNFPLFHSLKNPHRTCTQTCEWPFPVKYCQTVQLRAKRRYTISR